MLKSSNCTSTEHEILIVNNSNNPRYKALFELLQSHVQAVSLVDDIIRGVVLSKPLTGTCGPIGYGFQGVLS